MLLHFCVFFKLHILQHTHVHYNNNMSVIIWTVDCQKMSGDKLVLLLEWKRKSAESLVYTFERERGNSQVCVSWGTSDYYKSVLCVPPTHTHTRTCQTFLSSPTGCAFIIFFDISALALCRLSLLSRFDSLLLKSLTREQLFISFASASRAGACPAACSGSWPL